jgi:hypothetical protein
LLDSAPAASAVVRLGADTSEALVLLPDILEVVELAADTPAEAIGKYLTGRWQARSEMNDTGQLSELRSEIPLGAAMKRGFLGHCPSCGKTPLFKSYLKQVQSCPNCRAEFGHIQADNAALAHHHRGRASIPENVPFW